MQKITTLFILLCSFSVFANKVVLVQGNNAVCEKKYDVHRSKVTGVYSVTNPKVKDLGDKVEVTVTLNFLSCTAYTENGETKYKFEINNEHMNSTYQMLADNGTDFFDVERIDLKKDLVIYNNDSAKFKELTKVNVVENSGSEEVTFTIDQKAASVNNFPGAYSKGKYYIMLSIRTLTKYESRNGVNIGPMLRGSSQYRLFFSL